MTLRAAATAGMFAMLVATTVSVAAAPGGSCNLVKDPSGDVQTDVTGRVRPAQASDALDLTGGDIAADDRTVTTVIKVLGPVAADAYSPTGYTYAFEFTVDTGDSPQTFEMTADIGAAAQVYSLFHDDPNAGYSGIGAYIRGEIDTTQHTIRMTADMSQLQALAPGALLHPAGHRLRDFVVKSGTSNGDQRVAYVDSRGDDVARGYRPTKIGAPSCVRPG